MKQKTGGVEFRVEKKHKGKVGKAKIGTGLREREEDMMGKTTNDDDRHGNGCRKPKAR